MSLGSLILGFILPGGQRRKVATPPADVLNPSFYISVNELAVSTLQISQPSDINISINELPRTDITTPQLATTNVEITA